MPPPLIVSALRSHVTSAGYRQLFSAPVIAAIDQSLQHPDVFPIWDALADDPDPSLPYSLVDTCAHAISEWGRMPKIPDKEIAKHLSKLAVAAVSLADQLDKHAAEIAACGIDVTVNQYSARPSLASGRDVPYLDEVSGPATIQSVLRQYATRLRRPLQGLPELRPTKPRDVAAERTFLVKTVAHFFLTHGGKPHWDWVARLVSALTNTTELDARHAQRIFAHLEGTDWGQAEDYRPQKYDE